jgi:hypothetical protein
MDQSVLGRIQALLQEIDNEKAAADLSPGSPARKHLSKRQFAEPGERPKGSSKEEAGAGAYPIPDIEHARAALGFAAMHHGKNSAIYKEIARKVKEKFGDKIHVDDDDSDDDGDEKEGAAPLTALGHSGQGGKDPGTYKGPSQFPKVDAGTIPVPLGKRFRENHEDVLHSKGSNVDALEPAKATDQVRAIQVGTRKSPTGGDPQVEDNYRRGQPDPGTYKGPSQSPTAHAKDEWAQWSKGDDLEERTKAAYNLFNDILADIANGATLSPSPSPKNASPSKTNKEAAAGSAEAAQAGYDLAALAGNEELQALAALAILEKAAAEEMEKSAALQVLTENFIKEALEDADLVGAYLHSYWQAQQELLKQAEPPPPPPPPPPDSNPAMAAAAPGPPPPVPPQMAPSLNGAAGAGGLDEPVTGGNDHEEAINELFNALLELGITPDEILAALSHAGAGAGGEDQGPAGGKTASWNEAQKNLYKFAQLVQRHQRSGKARIKEALPGTRRRQERDEIKNYILEVCGR